jgi:hypothetical protein
MTENSWIKLSLLPKKAQGIPLVATRKSEYQNPNIKSNPKSKNGKEKI